MYNPYQYLSFNNCLCIQELSAADRMLIKAAQNGDLTMARNAINQGANVYTKTESMLGEGVTPLEIAAGRGNINIVSLLLNAGVDINFKNDLGRTVLTEAALAGRYDTVLFLLDRGAAVNSQDNGGYTPLDKAIEYGHENIVRLLWKRGGQTNRRVLFEKELPPVKRHR